MAFSLFGNKAVKEVQAWAKDYAQSESIAAQVIEAVKCGSTAQEAIELGRTLNYQLAQRVRNQNDSVWAERGSRSDRRR